jgi:hypothetical protein
MGDEGKTDKEKSQKQEHKVQRYAVNIALEKQPVKAP